MQLRNKRGGGLEVVPIQVKENDFIVFRPSFIDTNITIERKRNAPGESEFSATYYCEVEGELVESTGGRRILTENREIEELQQVIKKEMEKRSNKMVEKLQKKYNSDILKLGLKLRAQYYHEYWKHHEWDEEFKDFPIRVVYTVKLRRLGMEM
jgi:hypothetical protein